MESLNIALLQMDLAWEDPVTNRRKAEAMLRPLENLPDLIILPEMFTTGFTMDPVHHAESMGSGSLAWMRNLAIRWQAMVVGSLVIQDGDKFFNRLLVFSPQKMIYKYDKRHLFRMAGEDEEYSEGKEIGTFTCKGWRICPLICYDLRFPVWSRNRLKKGNPAYDLLLYVANWPEKRAEHWKLLLKARAVENQAYVAGVNRVGKDGNGIAYSGDSMVIDPQGKSIIQNSGEEKVLLATLHWDELSEYRERFPAWQDADSFDLNIR